MKKRIWAAIAAGALVGGAAVVGFGPLVRSQIDAKAARYGAEVTVEHVVPSWGGVRLRGVQISAAEVPGVRLWLDDVVIGWSDRRPRSLDGGKIIAIGEFADLLAQAEAWRAAHLAPGDGGSGTGKALTIEGFSLSWRNRHAQPSQSVTAEGLAIRRDGGEFHLRSSKAQLRWDRLKVQVEGGTLGLRRDGGSMRLTELSSDSLMAELQVGSRDALTGSMEAPSGSPSAGGTANATNLPAATPPPSVPSAAPSGEAKVPPANSHARVVAARRAHRLLLGAAQRLDGVLQENAVVAVRGARARLAIGAETLNLGPGTLRVSRDDGHLQIGLEPEPDSATSADSDRPLTFSLRVPLDEAKRAEPVEARLSGGPVWLSMLGIREGDMGLKQVERASLESDMRLLLPAHGRTLSIDGRGKLKQLSLSNQRIAGEPLLGMQVAWKADVEAELDGSALRVRHAELNLGDLRGLFHGNIQRQGEFVRVKMDFEVPLVTCQQALDSLPKAMQTHVAGMRLLGSFAMKGHANFDTTNLDKNYDVDWSGSNSCRFTEVPTTIDVQRFRGSFSKLVYSPQGAQSQMQFGPDTPHWVSLTNISRHMEAAVLTTEDGRFFRHNGFDQEAIINSIRENLRAKRFVRGASTISMQLAKNLYLPRTKTISRKLQEAVLTMYLEQSLTKAEMMELYLNVIEYGPMVYGIGPAARHYYNSTASRLSLGQALYLGAILSNPKRQFFAANGVVTPGRTKYLRRLMKIVHRRRRISDDELEQGLREIVVRGQPFPTMEEPEEPEFDTPPDGVPPSTANGITLTTP